MKERKEAMMNLVTDGMRAIYFRMAAGKQRQQP